VTPSGIFFKIGLFDIITGKNEEEKLTSALGIELQSPDANSNALSPLNHEGP
jgi:hypothetical protein